ncbi:MAG: Tol-Pal system beta propeller repeat protein TolB [Gammaproteobacteria bacterium]|nr:MAG: Tol-Pal system beta propeller repeat protein TolB [Gammaproteobacteria bacterium]
MKLLAILTKSVACIGLCLITLAANAELVIEITQGRDDAVSIAVVPFAWNGSGRMPEDISAIVSADLHRSGQFKTLAPADMLSTPTSETQVFFRDWKVLGVEYLLIGRLKQGKNGSYLVDFELFDVYQQKLIRKGNASSRKPRRLAHFISDEVYKQVTGLRGAFSTRLAYVTKEKLAKGKERYQLHRADADGYGDHIIVQSSEPILSPAWAPNGRHLAYVAYKSGKPAIYVVDSFTGEDKKVVDYPGLSSAPAFSPDGNRLAFVLSKDGNPEIYIKDFKTHKMERVTRHFSIDTEPTWAPDGSSLYFTSDRGGRPQIYRVDLASKVVKRVTFEGQENARGSLTSDGRYLVMVHLREGRYHIAVQDLVRDTLNIITDTDLDESPTISPNGVMVIYATGQGKRGVLAGVSVDGRVKVQFPSSRGDVREPAWSPFL